MRPEIDLSERHKEAVESYAEQEGYTMKYAYGQLIRDALMTRVSVDFEWGDEHEFAIKTQYDDTEIFTPISTGVDRSGEYVVSAENLQHVDGLTEKARDNESDTTVNDLE